MSGIKVFANLDLETRYILLVESESLAMVQDRINEEVANIFNVASKVENPCDLGKYCIVIDFNKTYAVWHVRDKFENTIKVKIPEILLNIDVQFYLPKIFKQGLMIFSDKIENFPESVEDFQKLLKEKVESFSERQAVINRCLRKSVGLDDIEVVKKPVSVWYSRPFRILEAVQDPNSSEFRFWGISQKNDRDKMIQFLRAVHALEIKVPDGINLAFTFYHAECYCDFKAGCFDVRDSGIEKLRIHLGEFEANQDNFEKWLTQMLRIRFQRIASTASAIVLALKN
ncbi:MAG: hypothetical protein OEV93_00675 [Candidatus Moranbacteria bacterium]|nr:hypothetical protein [Candidatus Moranbacteria bacterium]